MNISHDCEPTSNDDLESNDQEDSEFTLLTELVRNHYMNYLEKQLVENFKSCYIHEKAKSPCLDEQAMGTIKQAAKIMENKAVAACMIAQFYQRAMVKIISIVRRSTEENRLIAQLKKSILTPELTKPHYSTKETQTETGLLTTNNKIVEKKLQEPLDAEIITPQMHNIVDEGNHEMTLDEKIIIFQKHLNNEHSIKAVGRSHFKKLPSKRANNEMDPTRRTHNHRLPQRSSRHHHQHHRPYKENHQPLNEECFSPTNSVITPTQPPVQPPPNIVTDEQQDLLSKSINDVVADMENSNDSVAIELARLFSEEKTELDEIFGIDPNEEPDDPQICKILKEIEQAKVCRQDTPLKNNVASSATDTNVNYDICIDSHASLSPVAVKPTTTKSTRCVDLSKSLWPCELFMQRRKLSESLARLIEEDLRWHEVIKWRFSELFGDDSDDEFTPCSPSIDLDEILMGSCVKRISPWVVKHLMKPMNDGLIANRFVFKKLAKHIARSIITENQYPDESIIKGCVENYFCLHQAVMTLDDLHDVPSISLL